MVMDIALDKAELIALFVECILYGIFFVTFCLCIYILGCRQSTRRVNVPMALTATLLFACSTMHVSIDLARILDAFYSYRDIAGGPVAFLGNVHDVTHVMKSAVYISETLISDALVVYRCHVVSKRYIITLLLSLMVAGSAVAGYGSVYMLVHSPPIHGSIFSSSIAPWITSFNVITAATNIFATSLIAYSIWRVNKMASRASPPTVLSPVMLIIIESGAVYAFALLLLTALYTQNSNAQFIVLDGVSPLIGIVFCAIIIRVGLHPMDEQPEPTWLWTTQGILTNIAPVETVMTTVRTYPMDTTSTSKSHNDIQLCERKGTLDVPDVFLSTPSRRCSK